MAFYKVVFAKRVRKGFRGLQQKDAEKILHVIQALASEPIPIGSKKLKGEDLYRVRVGLYRVIYEIHGEELVVMVVKVGHRKDLYR